jgi:photosystem II stability/assembly factor-like uncharacterized protein
VHFADAATGFAVGSQNKVLRSLDGGETWAQRSTLQSDSSVWYGVSFVTDALGWIVGQVRACVCAPARIHPLRLCTVRLLSVQEGCCR